jgi:hypothetical protein
LVHFGQHTRLKFLFSNRQNPIEITFCGIAKKIKKRIKLKTQKLICLTNLLQQLKLPIAIEVPYNKQKFECELSKDNLKMKLKNISFEFDDPLTSRIINL